MALVLLKALGIWVLFIPLALTNAAVREKLLLPLLGPGTAMPLSGILLAALIFLLVWLLLPWLGSLSAGSYWLVGVLWLALTVAFELLFGHYVAGNSWEKLLGAYNPLTGNLWVVVLLTTFVSPFIVAKFRGWV